MPILVRSSSNSIPRDTTPCPTARVLLLANCLHSRISISHVSYTTAMPLDRTMRTPCEQQRAKQSSGVLRCPWQQGQRRKCSAHLELEVCLGAHCRREVVRDRKRVVLRALQHGDHLPHYARSLMCSKSASHHRRCNGHVWNHIRMRQQ